MKATLDTEHGSSSHDAVYVVDGSQSVASQWPTHTGGMQPASYVLLPHGADDQLGQSDRFSVHNNQENAVRTVRFMHSLLITILQLYMFHFHRAVMAIVGNNGDDCYSFFVMQKIYEILTHSCHFSILYTYSPITSSSSDSPLCTSITPFVFHFRLKTYLFHKSYPT